MAVGIYVHIPFCRAKCRYCDFNSYAGMDAWMEEYIRALCGEIRNYQGENRADTVYFGGGTPTALPPELLVRVLETIRERFELSSDCEITAECNPATMGVNGFKKLRNAGFNRLSIGLQTADDRLLSELGRVHTFADFETCFRAAREAGFENLSLDLIFGLPGQGRRGWADTLTRAVAFRPEHISCYALKIEEGTPFASMELDLPDDDSSRELYDDCVAFLEGAGNRRYEISNFAKPGYESRHNCKYWQCDDFAGFGAGAYSCIGGRRYDNQRQIPAYCMEIQTHGAAAAEVIPLSLEDRMSEFCFLGLRMTDGIGEAEFARRFGRGIRDVYGQALTKNERRGTLICQNGRIRIPSEWLYVCNGILVDFL